MPVLYSKFTFDFVHLDSAYRFLVTTPRVHQYAIRSISLSWIIQTKLYQKSDFYYIPGFFSLLEQLDDYRAASAEQSEWADVCKALASLPFLKNLGIIFYGHQFRISEKDLLGPLRKVMKPKNFQVEISLGAQRCHIPFGRTTVIPGAKETDDPWSWRLDISWIFLSVSAFLVHFLLPKCPHNLMIS